MGNEIEMIKLNNNDNIHKAYYLILAHFLVPVIKLYTFHYVCKIIYMYMYYVFVMLNVLYASVMCVYSLD